MGATCHIGKARRQEPGLLVNVSSLSSSSSSSSSSSTIWLYSDQESSSSALESDIHETASACGDWELHRHCSSADVLIDSRAQIDFWPAHTMKLELLDSNGTQPSFSLSGQGRTHRTARYVLLALGLAAEGCELPCFFRPHLDGSKL